MWNKVVGAPVEEYTVTKYVYYVTEYKFIALVCFFLYFDSISGGNIVIFDNFIY